MGKRRSRFYSFNVPTVAVRKNKSAVLLPDAENKSTNNNFLKEIYENKANERLRLLCR